VPVGRVDDGHHLVAARGEQPVMQTVDGEAGRFFATGQRPLRCDGESTCIDGREAVAILQVDEHASGAVVHREFRFGIQRDGAHHLVLRGIDGGDVAAAAVEREHALRRRLVQDCVRIVASGLDLREAGQRQQVEHDDAGCSARAHVAMAQ
jgi:hypothetical protein